MKDDGHNGASGAHWIRPSIESLRIKKENRAPPQKATSNGKFLLAAIDLIDLKGVAREVCVYTLYENVKSRLQERKLKKKFKIQ
jgi:hypothetical protein